MFIKECYCHKCSKTFMGSVRSGAREPVKCTSCIEYERQQAKAEYMACLDCLSVEERLRKVEEWIYLQNEIAESRERVY